MASFKCEDFADFSFSLEEIAQIPNETRHEMLEAGADIMVEALRDAAPSDTGGLKKSIKKQKKQDKNGFEFYYVLPTGSRRNTTGKHTKVTNASIGFIMEYGAPNRHIAARQWMKTAVEKNADNVLNAMWKIYEKFIESKGV